MLATQTPLTLNEILKRNVRIPVCPTVFINLIDALNNPLQQNQKLVDMLSSDASLTVQILKSANSAFYNSARAVRSVEEAIMRLGYTEIWSIAAACKGKEMFRAGTPELEEFFANQWDHSLKTGIFARTVAARMNPRFADVYFTAGILHDLGKLALAQVSTDYVALCERGARHGDDLVQRELRAYGVQHATLGAELLRHWRLPDLIAKPVAAHHDRSIDVTAKDSWRILAIADHLAHTVETSALQGRQTFKLAIPVQLAASVGLGKDDVIAITSETLRQIAVLRSI